MYCIWNLISIFMLELWTQILKYAGASSVVLCIWYMYLPCSPSLIFGSTSYKRGMVHSSRGHSQACQRRQMMSWQYFIGRNKLPITPDGYNMVCWDQGLSDRTFRQGGWWKIKGSSFLSMAIRGSERFTSAPLLKRKKERKTERYINNF